MSIQIVKELWPYIKPYKTKAIISFSLSFVLAGLTAWQVKVIKPIFDQGLSPSSTFHEVLGLALLLFALGLANFPARFFHFYFIRQVTEKMTNDVRFDVLVKLQKLPTEFYQQNKMGNLLSIALYDSEIFAQSLRAVIDLIREPAKGVAYLGLAIYTDWQLTIIIFLVAPLFVFIFNYTGKKIKFHQLDVNSERAELTHILNEGLAAHKITKAFNLQNFVLMRFKNSQDRYYSHSMKSNLVEELAHPLVELIGALAFSLIIIFAYFLIHNHQMTVGSFIQFIAAMALLMDPIRKYSQSNVRLSQGKASMERIKHIFHLPEEKDLGQILDFKFNRSIVIKNLTFKYKTQHEPTLKNISLEIKKGQKVAFVGLSGSGKSTLINLLLGLYPVEKNSIFIDDIDIQNIHLKSLRKLFGLVSQDIFLFNDTLLTNLTLGNHSSQDAIQNALEVSYTSEFIEKLPQKELTIIGDRGAKLSGGQAQRVTIARAFLQNPDIFLFDEATSALDNESENVVQEALDTIAKEKTVIAVAHRLSTIQDFDHIYVFKNGAIYEHGSHEELISRGSEYKKLYELSLKN